MTSGNSDKPAKSAKPPNSKSNNVLLGLSIGVPGRSLDRRRHSTHFAFPAPL